MSEFITNTQIEKLYKLIEKNKAIQSKIDKIKKYYESITDISIYYDDDSEEIYIGEFVNMNDFLKVAIKTLEETIFNNNIDIKNIFMDFANNYIYENNYKKV